MNNYPFRADVTKLFILVTDEDRDIGNPDIGVSDIILQMAARDVILHAFLNVTISGGATALDKDGNGYHAMSAGSFFVRPGATVTDSFENTMVPGTNENYDEPVFESSGLIFDLSHAANASRHTLISIAAILADRVADAIED